MMRCVALCLVLFLGAAVAHNITKRAPHELWHYDTFPHSSSQLHESDLSHFKPEDSGDWYDAADIHSNPSGSGNVLRVHYAKGSYSVTRDRDRGAGFYAHVLSGETDVLLKYDVMFSDNFDFVKGGKLPGLWGGGLTCSGGRDVNDCFTTRFMWRDHGDGEVYAYISKHNSDLCHQDKVSCNSAGYGASLGRGEWRFAKGRWQTVAQFLHLNTPGHSDGYIKVFLNDHKVFEIHGIRVRDSSSLKIDGFYFSTFFGGSSDDSWASTQDCYSYFKNFRLYRGDPGSSSAIG